MYYIFYLSKTCTYLYTGVWTAPKRNRAPISGSRGLLIQFMQPRGFLDVHVDVDNRKGWCWSDDKN